MSFSEGSFTASFSGGVSPPPPSVGQLTAQFIALYGPYNLAEFTEWFNATYPNWNLEDFPT